MINKKWRSYLMFSITASLLLVYQNCGAPLENRFNLSSKAASLPFAFDTEVDHIAFMSCSNMNSNYDTNAFWTFKVGAYNNGSGVEFREEYKEQTRKFSSTDRINAPAASPMNADVHLQLSARSIYNFQDVFTSNTNSAVAGKDYSNFPVSFDNTAITEQLVSQPDQKHNYFNALGLQGQIAIKNSYLASEAVSTNLINLLSNSGMLALTYNNSDSEPLRAHGLTFGSPNSVFGNGYKLSFRYGHGISTSGNVVNYSNAKPRVVASVQQVDLETQTTKTASWNCPEEYTFLIVREQDRGTKVLCGASQSGAEPIPTQAQKDSYETLRRILPATDWNVDLQKRCIVAKKAGDCYGSLGNNIKYTGGTCDPDSNECPHYLSICVKSN